MNTQCGATTYKGKCLNAFLLLKPPPCSIPTNRLSLSPRTQRLLCRQKIKSAGLLAVARNSELFHGDQRGTYTAASHSPPRVWPFFCCSTDVRQKSAIKELNMYQNCESKLDSCTQCYSMSAKQSENSLFRIGVGQKKDSLIYCDSLFAIVFKSIFSC